MPVDQTHYLVHQWDPCVETQLNTELVDIKSIKEYCCAVRKTHIIFKPYMQYSTLQLEIKFQPRTEELYLHIDNLSFLTDLAWLWETYTDRYDKDYLHVSKAVWKNCRNKG